MAKRIFLFLAITSLIGCGTNDDSLSGPGKLSPEQRPVAKWGEPGFSVLPWIAKTPSITGLPSRRDDMVAFSTLSKDGSCYVIRVGADTPDRFDPWFTLKLTRGGRIFREITNPETLEMEWALESTVPTVNAHGAAGPGKEPGGLPRGRNRTD